MGNGNVKSLQKKSDIPNYDEVRKIRKEWMSPLHRKSFFLEADCKIQFSVRWKQNEGYIVYFRHGGSLQTYHK